MTVTVASMSSSLGRPLTFGWKHAGFALLPSQAGKSAIFGKSAINYAQHSGFSTNPKSRSTSSNQPPAESQDFDYEAVKYDRAFLDFVRKRLLDRPDTGAYFKYCKEEPVRQAGVFMPLCIHNGVPSVLFTIRASHMRNHKGEVSFPGGKRDPTDKTILETALREMQEEVSISPEEVEVLGEYSAMPSKGCTMKVHPFVGFIKEPIDDISLVKYNESEVQKVFTVPIKDLMNPERRSMVQFRNSKFLYPVWKVEEENITIWGLTAFILDGVFRCLAKGGPTNFQEIPEGAKVEQYRPTKPSAFV